MNKSLFHRRKGEAKVHNGSQKTVIEVLSHGTSDCPTPAILLQTVDGRRHFFGGIGEGLQRCTTQNKIKMGKLQNIFLTGQLKWSSVGGLPGLLLTIADQGVNAMNVHSATKNLSWACAVWRHFIFKQGIELKPNELRAPMNNIYENSYFLAAGIPISSKHATTEDTPDQDKIDELAQEFIRLMFPSTTGRNAGFGKNGRSRSPSPVDGTSTVDVSSKLPPLSTYDSRSTCYIIQMKPTRGKFQVEKAKALGVPRGSLFRDLTSGYTVQTPDGRTVTPEDVLSEPTKGTRVLVIDCPGEEYVESVISQDWLQNLGKKSGDGEVATSENSPVRKRQKTDIFASDDGLCERPSVVYHMLGKSVNPFEGPYFEWMQSKNLFAEDCLHFVTHPDYAPDGISIDGAALLNMKMRYIYPENFNVLHTADAPKKFPSIDSVHPMLTLGIVSLDAKNGYDQSIEKCNGQVDWASLEPEVIDPLKQKLETAGIPLPPPSPSPKIEQKHLDTVEVITLGTGSALPSKYRNVVATLVRLEPGVLKSVLFDCGEATLGNMRRLYGPEKCKELVKEIGLLYLSHLHADHHLGALSIIKEWLSLTSSTEDKLYVMGPWKYFYFLSEWSQLEPEINMGRLRFVDNESVLDGFSYLTKPSSNGSPTALTEQARSKITGTPSFFAEMQEDLNLKEVRTCKARHCDLAYCASFTFRMGEDKSFKVSYSGDTKPVNFFAFKVGKNSDLLIHEATHENDLKEEAEKKGHSTMGQALDIAKMMNAKYTVLTHFSQRYPKLPDIQSSLEGYEPKGDQRRVPRLLNEIIRDKSFNHKEQAPPEELKVALGFDGLRLKLSDIPQQKLKYEQLKLLFEDVANEEIVVEQLEEQEEIAASPKKGKKNKKQNK